MAVYHAHNAVDTGAEVLGAYVPPSSAAHVAEHARRARALFQFGEHEKALVEMTTYLTKLAARHNVLRNLSNTHEMARAFAERAFMYYESGDYQRAIADFDQVIERSTEYPASHTRGQKAFYFRGLCFQALGKFDDAASDYGRVAELVQ